MGYQAVTEAFEAARKESWTLAELGRRRAAERGRRPADAPGVASDERTPGTDLPQAPPNGRIA